MVSQLLSPKQPKNLGDLLVIMILAFHIAAFFLLPRTIRRPIFAAIFLFWRASYNVGIGYLLHIQSNDRRLITWARKFKIFTPPATGLNPYPELYRFLKRELETKIPVDYSVATAPIEYNTWLVFRRVVDLILMCDFMSYCLFAVACGHTPELERPLMTAFRWIAGWSLVGFNLWVKLDAHRVVKDYAWYWGDFFFLIDQELTFDGVFEMAPHPMYSVGYAGYYGISLMAGSYEVLFISIIAHAAQFAFLVWVENPHIEKTYNPPMPRDRTLERCEETPGAMESMAELASPGTQPSGMHTLIGLKNMDFYRLTDVSVALLVIYHLLLTLLTPSTPFFQVMFVIHAFCWRLWYSLGIGYILNQQSVHKLWTRHFVKYGDGTEEAWRQWKGTYHVSMVLCYCSFIAAAWKVYSPPADWGSGLALLKHIVGLSLISLQTWTSVSIYDSLGEFGWFYGDFFFDHSPKLTYSGIYRFLNNPERVIGLAGVWGAVLITSATPIFLLALTSHILSLIFIQFVERPHMQKLYGESLRRESGLVKSLKRSLPPPFRQWQNHVDALVGEAYEFVEELIDVARPKLADRVDIIVRDSSALFKQPALITITRLDSDLTGFNPCDYSLEILTRSSPVAEKPVPEYSGGRSLIIDYGMPIRVRWRAPRCHSPKDWIGLYLVADNPSKVATRIISHGRWIATCPEQYDSRIADLGIISSDIKESQKTSSTSEFVHGEMEFSGDKLWWTTGIFEFRYHHNGKHNVMAMSESFELCIRKFEADATEIDSDAVEEVLLPLVQNCFDRNPDIAPASMLESFGSLVERDGKYARRVVVAVHQM